MNTLTFIVRPAVEFYDKQAFSFNLNLVRCAISRLTRIIRYLRKCIMERIFKRFLSVLTRER